MICGNAFRESIQEFWPLSVTVDVKFFPLSLRILDCFQERYGCTANNSFLLHGYYNYRHLILARLSDSGGKIRYLLGVPGHYFSNEKYMASMFGFPHFVLAKKQPDEDGRFGTGIRISACRAISNRFREA